MSIIQSLSNGCKDYYTITDQFYYCLICFIRSRAAGQKPYYFINSSSALRSYTTTYIFFTSSFNSFWSTSSGIISYSEKILDHLLYFVFWNIFQYNSFSCTECSLIASATRPPHLSFTPSSFEAFIRFLHSSYLYVSKRTQI